MESATFAVYPSISKGVLHQLTDYRPTASYLIAIEEQKRFIAL